MVLAVLHYATLLGVAPGSPAAWALPASYAAAAVIGLGWGLVLRARRPQVYADDRAGRPRRHRPARPRPPGHAVMTAPRRLTPVTRPDGGPRGRGRPGCPQPGHRRRVRRSGAVPVADRRPGRPPGDLPRLLPAAAWSTPWPCGVVHTTPGRTAAALWLPAGAGTAAPPGGHDERLAAATGPWTGRFAAFDAALDRHHPAGIPHHHLAILAVRPDRQGRGTGTALLRRLPRGPGPRPACPPTWRPPARAARDLYLAHGYALRPGAPIHLPGGGPPMWPMWREPAASPAPPGLTATEPRTGTPAREQRM